MAILFNQKLMNMSLTVRELSEKHQLNPDNNGVLPIDQYMYWAKDQVAIGSILRIHAGFYDRVYSVTFEDIGVVFLSCRTELLIKDGDVIEYRNILGENIRPSCSAAFCINGKIVYKSILQMNYTGIQDVSYDIRTNRGNILLDNGLIVNSD